MNTRRSFLRNSSLAAGLLLLKSPLHTLAANNMATIRLAGDSSGLLLHYTNDMHGNVFQGMDAGDLLLDAGDFTDGSTNHHAHLEVIHAMNAAGYHAATIGNRELANGTAALAALIPAMKFALVNCNYHFEDTKLAAMIKPALIVQKGLIKIGITGVGTPLPGVAGVTVTDPVEAANAAAAHLRKQGCQLVICLSHLGYDTTPGKVSNYALVHESTDIDFIAGGHQHNNNSYLRSLRNAAGKEVLIGHTCSTNATVKGELAFSFNESQQLMQIMPAVLKA
ncbi:metallophosphoesterase [Chitinophaga sp. Cy-1792]|uniref:metallophosphoesterase n=1 Tax=Chitinophaga sp. Cy-1792 TaxID=2608339 RepID=UPI001423092F|nr:metallophosphoesterase [Chitinophaga sp. Cy-1792]NIG54509.1 hypothetical protein [Chitinophaga sp. Cy-1792]